VSTTTLKYQENVFLNQKDKDTSVGSVATSNLQGCDSYWTIKNDINEAYGQLTIPVNDRGAEINIRTVLSIDARLPSVRKKNFHRLNRV
jgi:hypothetical protein